MAVKQNNSEGNGSTTDANQDNVVNGVKSTGTITKSKKMNSNGTNGDAVNGALATGVNLDSGGSTELPGCSGNTGTSPNIKFVSTPSDIGSGSANVATGPNTIARFINLIDIIESRQPHVVFLNDPRCLRNLVLLLSKIQSPTQTPEDLKRFKEDMNKIGLFFAKHTENSNFFPSYFDFFWYFVNLVDGGNPSPALAVIFQLFNTPMIVEAVESMLKQNFPDQNIRKTVTVLCEWLCICTFCQNLPIWIMVILKCLKERNKNNLVEQISIDNIDHLFRSIVIPVLRPKVAPVLFLMLSFIDKSPVIFHKILPRFTFVINLLKLQSNSTEGYAVSTKEVLQQLVDITSQLMARFYRYDNIYDPIESALEGLQPSNNYMNYAYSSKSFESPTENANAKVGLVNLGNTCYMNSVLQALAMTKEFSREILISESKSPLLIKMKQQIAFMLYSTRQELTPSKVLNATRPPGFSPGLQQDSSEFLGYLLETLHEQEVAFQKKNLKTLQNHGDVEPLNKQSIKVDNRDESGATAICREDDDEKDDVGVDKDDCLKDNISETDAADSTKSTNLQTNKTTSLSPPNSCSSQSRLNKTSIYPNSQISTIEKTFTGKLATTYKCLTCDWKSCNIDSFRDLQLSFPDVKNDCASNYSVQDLIEYYCSSEKLYGDNQYFCERCKKLSDAERYINFISAPKNIILTLKHFKYDQKYHMRAKLMHKVFHDEKVSLKVCDPKNLEEISTVHYDLYAGVVHSGFSMDSGHYYTYASDASNKWYKFNDNIVTPSRTEELHNLTPPNTPYILFYQMGARSNDTPETSASTKVIKVDVPIPLTLEELPTELRDMVLDDNLAFSEELRIRRYKNASSVRANAMKLKDQRRDSYEDEDDEQPPPTSGCGDNAMNINMNRYVY